MTNVQFDAQYQKLVDLIEKEFAADPDRVTKLKDFYETFKDRLRSAPASTKKHYHNAYPGGYLDHVLRVIDTLFGIIALYKKQGGTIDFTRSEAVFAAMHHDLGKLGDEDGEMYIPETSDWHRVRGAMFKYNDAPQYLTVHDRTMYLLQACGIKFTKNEMLGIKLADGMYAPGNEKYFMNNDPFPMKSALPYLVHWADHMACVIEKTAMRVQEEGK